MRVMVVPVNKYLVCTVSLLLVMAGMSMSQNSADSIQIRKINGGDIFVYQGKRLKPKELVNITQSNDEARKLMHTAKNNYDLGVGFGSVGGFMIGFPIGGALAGGEMNWALFATGAVLTVAAIGFSVKYKKVARHAVKVYNQGLSPPTSSSGELWFGVRGQEFVLRATF